MATQPQNWEKVKAIFQEALEKDSSVRSDFLRDKCPDAEIRFEVERLLAEYEQAGGFLSTPALDDFPVETEIPTQRLLQGQLLAGRFRIVRFIAAGGMGEVYEAEDQELRERVAVKVIRPEILAQPNALVRFRREVHLARKVTHPNVCRIFDLFRHKHEQGDMQEEIVFISMELLYGKTLEQQLKADGPFNLSDALPLLQQMASALAAAHAVGIVHRDFKPGNVVLMYGSAPKWRAVVTDFGLAHRPLTTDKSASISTGEGVLGTPAYMSPEQLEGRLAETASDIYAFGLVIYEMVTGAKPFRGDTPLSAALKRLTETPIPPHKFKPDLSTVWESVILRCLERDPSKRFTDVGEIAQALSGTKPSAQSVRVSQRALIVSLIGLLIVTTGATIYVQRVRNVRASRASPPTAVSAPSPVRMRPAVAVLGFRNISRRSQKDWLSEALTEGLNSELSQGSQLRLISGESVARMKIDLSLPDSDSYAVGTLRQIRKNIAADYVIQGSFLDLGDQTSGEIRVDARLQDAQSGETVDSIIENGNEADLNGLLVKTGTDLREKLKVNAPSAEQQTQSRAALPKNLEAARYYAEGLQKLRAFDSLGARDFFEMAVEKEPTFALAHSALAAAWTNLGYDTKARDSAKKAVELSASLDDENRCWIEAQFYEVSHDQGKAVATYESLFSAHPDNLEYGLRLLAAMVRGGQFTNARSIVDALKGLPAPAANDPRIDLLSANAAFASGDYKQSVILANAAETKAEFAGGRLTEALALMRRGAALNYLGQKKEAVELDEKALRIFAEAGDRDDVAKMNANLGAVLNDEANYAEGMKSQKESLEEFRRIGDKRGEAIVLSQLGWGAEAQDRLDEAQVWYDQALVIDQELDDESLIADVTSKLAEILQYKGDLSGATRKNEQVLAIAKESGNLNLETNALNNLVELYSTRGDLVTAKQLMAQADTILDKTGAKRGTAQALAHWGGILASENNLVGAQQKYEESLNILALNDEKGFLPYVQMSLAETEIEQGRTSESEALLAKVIGYFHSQRNSADEGWAMGIYAKAELESGNIASARQKAEQAKALCAHDQTGSSQGVRLVAARIEGLTGNRTAAETELRNILKMAERQGNVPLAFDARFALGEIALKSQDPTGRKILNNLSSDAASKGFLLVSRKARFEIGR